MKKIALCLLAFAGIASLASAANPYVAFSGGYFLDGQDPLFTARIGTEVARQEKVTHSVEAEIGISRSTDYGITMDVVPIMANYRLGLELLPKLSLELGAGIGLSWNRLDYYGSSSDTAFAYQVLAGLNLKVSEKATVYGGVRYLNIGECTLKGITAEVGDDTALELGMKFKF